MHADDHRRVMAELDELRLQVVATIRRFEISGMASVLKHDYVALHAMEHRITEMRRAHADAIETGDW